MHGGYREGSGRKPILESDKKKNRNIYITDKMYEEIMSLDLEDCNSFSQRCQLLLNESLSKYNTK